VLAYRVTNVITIQGKIYGLEDVLGVMDEAPGEFHGAMVHAMYSTRKRYIGNKREHGKFRKTLLSKRYSGTGIYRREGTWPTNIVKTIRGKIYGNEGQRGSGGVQAKKVGSGIGVTSKMSNLKMIMGQGIENPNKFTEGFAMLDEAYTGSRTITGKGKTMPMPVYKNLAKFYTGSMSKAFYTLMRAGKLIAVKAGMRVLYYAKSGGVTFSKYKKGIRTTVTRHGDLLFVGVKSVTVGPRYNFQNMMLAGKPQMIARANRLISDRARKLLMVKYGHKMNTKRS